ncbi:hypothetical protein Terro_4075 [Terriglobus roseus DSM 18391]|uniref:Uncharacterized protein n=1 Tax=Terriglobus roseus (strain DSM 18391 / NRRL B-41598 / KBS 63) TaxID=926566 RepID=I3ZM14_TERRK|nr:hypothetical protein [Terriglobus roseus]AFL90282.1 hypothetical protein Terro_4075 [Terriglobus roseus DSM 18391]
MTQDSRSTDPRSLQWQSWAIPMAAGFVFSSLVVLLAVPGPAHILSWRGLFSRSAGLMALAAAASLAMLWAVARTFRDQIAEPTASLRAYAWSAAIWLPLLFILWSEHAVWVILAPVPIAAILTHFTRRQCLAAEVAPVQDDMETGYPAATAQTGSVSLTRFRSAIFSAAGSGADALFAAATAPRTMIVGLPAVVIALLLQAVAFTFAIGLPALSETLLILLTAATVWLFTTVAPQEPGSTSLAGTRGRRAAVLPCFLLTCLALTPLLQAGLNASAFSHAVMAGARAVTPPAIQRDPGHAYTGVVLLAPPMPRRKILTPAPVSLQTHSFRPARPLVIPFDGAYRYLALYPQRGAHELLTQRGDPVIANVHTTDNSPLTMEARQRLGGRIQASCCRGIDVDVVNGDDRFGRIDIEMLLEDVTPGGKTVTRSLGTAPVRSSLEKRISINRAPINETLHFDIAANASQMQFNNILLRFKLSEHRNRAGAKVRIKDFRLTP